MSEINGKIFLTNNECYKTYQKMTPKGIVVHSTGANNPNLRRYIAPDDGIIGKNDYNNDWNRSGVEVCVHGFIGYDKNKNVKFYQTLPFDICCWGVGGGSNGSYNYNPAYIQFEMCEDDLTDKSYCQQCYNKAVAVCTELCTKYGVSVNNIVSHHEAGQRGYGSGHIDPDNWWSKFGYTMGGFRKDVQAKLGGKNTTTSTPKKQPTNKSSKPDVTYMVRTGGKWLPEVKNLEDYAGICGQAITDVAIKVSKGSVKYRVHERDGKWLPYVTGCNIKDAVNGYAGRGTIIDAVEIIYYTPNDVVKAYGYLYARYRVSPVGGVYYDWQNDNNTNNGQDGYAGCLGKPIDRLQITFKEV